MTYMDDVKHSPDKFKRFWYNKLCAIWQARRSWKMSCATMTITSTVCVSDECANIIWLRTRFSATALAIASKQSNTHSQNLQACVHVKRATKCCIFSVCVPTAAMPCCSTHLTPPPLHPTSMLQPRRYVIMCDSIRAYTDELWRSSTIYISGVQSVGVCVWTVPDASAESFAEFPDERWTQIWAQIPRIYYKNASTLILAAL